MNYYIAFKVGQVVTNKIKTFITEHCSGYGTLIPTPLDRIHVTTMFLGQMPQQSAESILHLSTPFSVKAFSVHVGGLKAFQPLVLYAEVSCPTDTIKNLHDSQQWFYNKLTGNHGSTTPEFVPHLTLAKSEPRFMSRYDITNILQSREGKAFEGGDCYVNAIGLYCKSELVAEVELS